MEAACDLHGMKITLKRAGAAAFEATSDDGLQLRLDGPPALGGEGTGMRPMQLVLVGLAGCSAMDVIHILRKQSQPLEDLEIEVDGHRADAVPAVFDRVVLTFTASGELDPRKLARAVQLSVDKYCSVAAMLKEVDITFRIRHRTADGAVDVEPAPTET